MTPTFAEQANSLLGVHLTPEQEAQFAGYRAELVAWNAQVNLTAITDPAEVQVKHFLDSLTVVRAVSMTSGLRVADVGTGAGFPGLPLAIAFPAVHVGLIEATGKKVAFLQHVAAALKLDNVTTVNARAEEAGQLPNQRATYDVVTARAVARLPSLLEYMLPLAKVGGKCVAMKGKTAFDEARDATRALALLGGKLHGIETVQLPGVDEPHYLVVVEKITPTPIVYPRKPGIPTRKPL